MSVVRVRAGEPKNQALTRLLVGAFSFVWSLVWSLIALLPLNFLKTCGKKKPDRRIWKSAWQDSLPSGNGERIHLEILQLTFWKKYEFNFMK
jgi:hypothetical protein